MDILGKAKELAEEGLEKAKEVAAGAGEKAKEGTDAAGGFLGGLKDKLVDAAENLTHKDLDGDGKIGGAEAEEKAAE